MFRRGILVVWVSLLAGCGGGEGRVTLSAHAPSAFADSPPAIRVRGLDSDGELRASWTSFAGTVWRSRVPLRAAAGDVTLTARDPRLITGMRPDGPQYEHPFFLPPPLEPGRMALSVVVDGRTVARSALPRNVTAPDLPGRELTRRKDGLVGYLFRPRHRGHRPAVLLLGGSEGGNAMVDAAGLLASHGYPTLALAYFGAPGVPSRLVRIPLEYFARAVRLLRSTRGVDPDRVVVMGASRGGEAALLLAATFPRILHGAIGLVPSATVYPSPAAQFPAWTRHGHPVPLEPIRVERISGPVLTVGAGDDRVWSSKPSVRQIERRLDAHHFRFPHRAIVYEHAGHLVGAAIPYLPAPTSQAGLGGTPQADAAAKADLWPRILGYLARLGGRA